MAPVMIGIAFSSSFGVCRIFLKEFLKENSDRLRNIIESFKRQGRVLMLIHHFSARTSEWCLAGHHYPERYS